MSKVLPRDVVKRQLAARLADAPTLDAAAIDAHFNAAVKAARLPDKPTYRPEEVAAIGQAMMTLALKEIVSGIAQYEASEAEKRDKPTP